VLPTVVVGLASAVFLTYVFGVLVTAENPDHALGHVASASLFLIVAFAAVRFWPAPRPGGAKRLSRGLVVGGCSVIAAALLLEAVGAFGYDGEKSRVGLLTALHNGVWPLGVVGFLGLVVGMLLAAVPGKRGQPDDTAV